MNLEDIENGLPNGFHDAFLQRVIIDYAKREATLNVSVWVGEVLSEDIA